MVELLFERGANGTPVPNNNSKVLELTCNWESPGPPRLVPFDVHVVPKPMLVAHPPYIVLPTF